MSENKKERSKEELVKEFLGTPGEFAKFHSGMSEAEKATFKSYLDEMRVK